VANNPFLKSCNCGFLAWRNKECSMCKGTGVLANQVYFKNTFQYELECAGMAKQESFLPQIEAGIRALSSFPHLKKDYVTNSLYFDKGLILLDMYKANRNTSYLREAKASLQITLKNGGNHVFSDDFLKQKIQECERYT